MSDFWAPSKVGFFPWEAVGGEDITTAQLMRWNLGVGFSKLVPIVLAEGGKGRNLPAIFYFIVQ